MEVVTEVTKLQPPIFFALGLCLIVSFRTTEPVRMKERLERYSACQHKCPQIVIKIQLFSIEIPYSGIFLLEQTFVLSAEAFRLNFDAYIFVGVPFGLEREATGLK